MTLKVRAVPQNTRDGGFVATTAVSMTQKVGEKYQPKSCGASRIADTAVC
jgi:hypothetical protein